MRYGIGVRYSEQGVRLLKLDYSDKGLKITGVAAGQPLETISSFFNAADFDRSNTPIVLGLGPGHFISTYLTPEDGMSGSDIESHLTWQMEHKLISGPVGYKFDYFITDTIGCMFAGRQELLDSALSLFDDLGLSGESIVTDVESVALYNGSEGAGEIGTETIMLTSLEAEGISSLILENGSPSALETVAIEEESLINILPGLDQNGMNAVDDKTIERMAGYVIESLSRLTSFGEHDDKPTPRQIVLSGGGIYLGNGIIAERINEKTNIPTMISNPLKPLLTNVPEDQADLVTLSAAFTTCFGLALRALED